jgi:hypothetical protein
MTKFIIVEGVENVENVENVEHVEGGEVLRNVEGWQIIMPLNASKST